MTLGSGGGTSEELDMQIQSLGECRDWIPALAESHFAHWGRLTGFPTYDQYQAALERWSHSETIPVVLVASRDLELLGSVNLVSLDMEIRPALTPWIGQLFVPASARRRGVGAALVETAIAHASRCGFTAVYLYTGGTLPQYYASLGWAELERIEYLGKERTVMKYDIDPTVQRVGQRT